MKPSEKTNPNLEAFLRWTPRVLLLVYGLSLMFFPLGGFSETNMGELLKRIPAFTVLLIAFLTWNHPVRTPRILTIIFILFLLMPSLDVFMEHLGFWHTVLGLLMHNIPALILLLILILAWKHELVGAVAFTFAGLLYAYFLVKGHRPAGWFILIGAPALLIGVCFFLI
jgi:hypothetical protein